MIDAEILPKSLFFLVGYLKLTKLLLCLQTPDLILLLFQLEHSLTRDSGLR